MYSCLYKHLKENYILYKKQFGFQQKHSTEYAILQLIDQVNNSFERNQFTLGIYIFFFQRLLILLAIQS